MSLDSTTGYLLFQKEHQLRVEQAQRDRLVGQAAASRSRQPVTALAMRKLGVVLVAVGERLQGSPNRTDTGDVADSAGTFQPSR